MSQVALTGNFLSTARTLIFLDTASVTWSFNQNTNTLTATSAGGGSGTVTSVGLSDGSASPIYTISGSAVTTSGTLTFTLATQTAHFVLAGPTSGVAAQPTFRALVATDIPTIAYSSLSGTPTIPAGANPTASVGLAAANGVATSFMRSDGAPALDQTIAPTWTGNHTFTPTAGTNICNGVNGSYAVTVVGSATSGGSFGLIVEAGTTNADAAIRVANKAVNINFFEILGDGSGFLGSSATNGIQWTSAGALTCSTATVFKISALVNAGTGGLGYGTGVGGTVTQITSRTTGVTLSKLCGAITLFAAAGSATIATFTVTNTVVAATDVIVLSVKSGTNVYICHVTAVAAGSFNISFQTTGGTASDSPVINFAVIKAVTA